ncbi:MAG: hypothetical protein NNA20_10235 [Nitrospira sp.]|nr:hypothetical protein [Nitrospira sp.]MCP9442964.1 hypothetical protein [Nitrospira sp.]
MGRGGRRPGEPIYLRRHILALAGAVALPVVIVQGYKAFVGPLSFDVQLLVVIIVSIFSGIGLHYFYRSSARNEP